ncbi:MAG TPA: 2-C-methyl-D-erythritol 2,4-cyclodiphosphate synthase [Syntrophales bacterium]|nr:2-C-methyl-D-erythritol 2,4-cyclodiphosphate synthase [Syntrophales bacterium]
MRIGFGYDSHRFSEGRRLIIGGVEVNYEMGLLGHSDADALIHAIVDAIIGALGEGDIGRHFPDTDASLKGISSLVILKRVSDLAVHRGYYVNNIDSTVVLEKPRLSPSIEEMRRNIAKVLGTDSSRVNVKAKTNEKMGFIGRGEGIAAFAVVTLAKSEEDYVA